MQLVCHHNYGLPFVAVDLSRNENHGAIQHAAHQVDGLTAGSGGVVFQQADSAVRIPPSATLGSLRALRIEVVVRVDPAAATPDRMNIVEGHLGFAFFINPAGVLVGTFLGVPPGGGAPDWHGVESRPPYSPDGGTHTVPVGAWTTLSYFHDGIRTLELAIDGNKVARRDDLVSAVGAIGSFGTAIGSWPDMPRFAFGGVIDDVKIWRYDPDAMLDEFFSRPMGAAEGECWATFFEVLRDRLRQGDRDLVAFMGQIMGTVRSGVRNAAADPAFFKNDRSRISRFLELWQRGDITGDAMRALLSEWLPDLLARTGIDPNDADLRTHLGQIADHEVARAFRDCDPQFRHFLGVISDIVGRR